MTAGADRYERLRVGGADADRLVGEADGQRLAIAFAVGDDGLDPEGAAGAQDPQRDLAAVRDEDLAEHQRRLGGSRRVGGGGPARTVEADGIELLAVLDGVAQLDEARAEDPVDGRHDLLGHAQDVHGAEPVAGPDARRRHEGRSGREDADRRRGRDRAATLGPGGLRLERPVERSPGARLGPIRPARAPRDAGAIAGRSGPAALAVAGRRGRGMGPARPAGRRSRTRQPPSRTSSSPRPVAPSLAMRAGSSSSVRRSMAAWSAARSAASRPSRSGDASIAWGVRALARPPRGPGARRATRPR